MRPYPLLIPALLAFVPAAFGQQGGDSPKQSSQDWNLPDEGGRQGIQIEARAVESLLGDKNTLSRQYYEKHCVGDVLKIPRNVQQVCYRQVVCDLVPETFSPLRQQEWCQEEGNHLFPKDVARLIGEFRAETQAWKDAESSIKSVSEAWPGSLNKSFASGMRSVIEECRGRAVQAYARPRLCVIEKLDAWRKPIEADSLQSWRVAHLMQSPPDHVVGGMTGQEIKESSDGLVEGTVKNFNEHAKDSSVPLASALLYDNFIRGQELKPVKTPQEEKKDQEKQDQTAKRIASVRENMLKGLEPSAAPPDSSPAAGKPAPSAAAAAAADSSAPPVKGDQTAAPAPTSAGALTGDASSAASFKPAVPKKFTRRSGVPSPNCPTKSDLMDHSRKCGAVPDGKAALADYEECLSQVRSWWDRRPDGCKSQ